ncbi:MAG: prolipoprotein diacylglyceryl transferase [Burkholderiales bacterium]|nr:prolipoprotein diacylglyceryl transferase [Burkholderiales bacterium]MCA3154220.1 prolipoprotein diacylglyceryl transferase [Burkholderiales bacterium]MCA3157479.1 prolipoprotein diacylglyceryl transferase [Burkholderiales bacterium]
MWIHPQFDPIALQLGPLAIRWYGLMYLLAFVLFVVLARWQLRRPHIQAQGWSVKDIDDMLFWGVIGVVLGGRLGYVVFYKADYYLQHPLEALMIWHGGMSFHGGLLGVVVALGLWARSRGLGFIRTMDFIAPCVPTGLAAGRMGNFINGELWGRETDVPWAMVFPQAGDSLPRHPSQLYQFALEGLALFFFLWWFARQPRAAGMVSAAFLVGYGVCRFIAEFGRQPDAFLGLLAFNLSMGQWLSLPMIAGGAVLALWAKRQSMRGSK